MYTHRWTKLHGQIPQPLTFFKAHLKFRNEHMDDTFRMLWSDETKIESFGYSTVKQGEAFRPKNTLSTVKDGGGSIVL